MEKNMEKGFDKIAEGVADTIGVKEIPWFKFTLYLTFVYCGISILVLFHRQDFINLTICVVSLYMLLNVDRLTHYTFRALVFCLFFSLFVDLFWFALKTGEYGTD